MVKSASSPEATYEHFSSRVPVTKVSRDLGITKATLRRWWVAQFGAEAYEKRVASSRVAPDEKKEKRRAYRIANKDKSSAQKATWRKANPEKVKAMKRTSYNKHRDTHRAYFKSYYATHSEEFKLYRAENKDAINARNKEYFTEHPEVLLYKGAKQRAVRKGLPFSITPEDVLRAFPDDGCCPITKEPFKRGSGKVVPTSMTLDRIVPELGYVPGNIAVISHLANTIKQNCVDPEVFIRLASYIRGASCP
jgi:transposase-like protein